MGRFDGNAIVIDLSSYEKGQKLKPYVDAGATHFIFRMWYQGQYVYGDWRNQEDAAYRAWYDEAKSLGAKVGGYFLYCAGVDDQDYQNSEIILDGIGEVMHNGYKPDFLYLDDEVNKWWQSGRTVTATAPNHVKGLRILIDKCWKQYQLVTGYYSRVSYIKDNNYTNEIVTWMDNVNRVEKVVPNWWAAYRYYKVNLSMTSLTSLISVLSYPTSTYENNYLNLGSRGMWDLWQFAGDVVTPFGKCDISVSRLPLAQFNAAHNISTTTPPPTEPPGDDTNSDTTITKTDFDALVERVKKLEAHTHGGPLL